MTSSMNERYECLVPIKYGDNSVSLHNKSKQLIGKEIIILLTGKILNCPYIFYPFLYLSVSLYNTNQHTVLHSFYWFTYFSDLVNTMP